MTKYILKIYGRKIKQVILTDLDEVVPELSFGQNGVTHLASAIALPFRSP